MATSAGALALKTPAPAGKQGNLDAAGGREFLSFWLGEEEYGIDILKVREIRSFEKPTRIANAPAHVLGVLNLRGDIVPIYDLRLRYGLANAGFSLQTVTIVLAVNEGVVGVVVDAVSDVVDLAAHDIRPAPEISAGVSGDIATECILGLGVIADGERQRMLILTDIERLMSSLSQTPQALPLLA